MKKTVLRVILAAMVLIALSIFTENPAVVGIGVWGFGPHMVFGPKGWFAKSANRVDYHHFDHHGRTDRSDG